MIARVLSFANLVLISKAWTLHIRPLYEPKRSDQSKECWYWYLKLKCQNKDNILSIRFMHVMCIIIFIPKTESNTINSVQSIWKTRFVSILTTDCCAKFHFEPLQCLFNLVKSSKNSNDKQNVEECTITNTDGTSNCQNARDYRNAPRNYQNTLYNYQNSPYKSIF